MFAYALLLPLALGICSSFSGVLFYWARRNNVRFLKLLIPYTVAEAFLVSEAPNRLNGTAIAFLVICSTVTIAASCISSKAERLRLPHSVWRGSDIISWLLAMLTCNMIVHIFLPDWILSCTSGLCGFVILFQGKRLLYSFTEIIAAR